MAEHGGKQAEIEAGGEAAAKSEGGVAAVALARASGRGGGKSDPRMDAFPREVGTRTTEKWGHTPGLTPQDETEKIGTALM